MERVKNKIYLTFDLEEWPVQRRSAGTKNANCCYNFSYEGCMKLVELLDRYKIKGTFFTTGYFASSCPQIVKMLADKGHEIACHGFFHVNLTKYSTWQIEDYIKRSKKILNDLSGQKVIGFRAPYFNMNKRVINILKETGFKYDSSVHPAIIPGYYYNFKSKLSPYYLNSSNNFQHKENKAILEIPVSVIPGIRFPISWWWMRHLGVWITILGCKINLIQKRSVVLYFHPWEFSELSKMKGIPSHITSKCGQKNLNKLDKVIASFVKKYKFDILRAQLENNSGD